MNHLYPFQEADIQTMLTRRHNLLAWEPGLGKTVAAVEMVNRLKCKNTLTVCPASTKRHWQRMLNEWLQVTQAIQIIDHRTDYVDDFADIVIVNYDLVAHSHIRFQLKERKWDLLICDEAHRLMHFEAKRTEAILSNDGVIRNAARSLMITGTPVLNRPIELFPILRVCAPAVIAPYKSYFGYAKRYCGGHRDGFSFWDKGASNTSELNLKLKTHYMVRRLTKEVENELPARRYEMVLLDASEEIKHQVRVIVNADRLDFKKQDLSGGGVHLATLRRKTAEAKLETARELITEYASVDKLVVFAYHREIIERLAQLLEKRNPVILHGGKSQTERENAIQRFQTDPSVGVFIGQIQAAGEGVDGLQRAANNVLFIEWSWVPGEIEQACKRVHRLGQTKPVLIRFLIWADSVEEHMMRTALDKVKVIREILK